MASCALAGALLA